MSEASELGHLPESALQTPMRLSWHVLALAGFVLLALWLGLSVGRGGAASAELRCVILTMRSYRTAAAFLSGAGFAVAGVIVQGLFRNPLASPSTLGTSAGSMLGGQFALVVSVVYLKNVVPEGLSRELAIPLGCLVGAFLALGVLLALGTGQTSVITLVLTGFVLESLFTSIGSMLPFMYQSSWQLARALNELGTGSVAGSGLGQVLLGLCLVVGGTLPALLLAPTLDVLVSGEEEARALGVDVATARFLCVLWASLLTAGAVAMGGNVLFIGLVVPHALRPFVGERHIVLLPASFFVGGALLVLCDVAVRVAPGDGELPLALLTGVLGAPVFLWMLRNLFKEGRHG